MCALPCAAALVALPFSQRALARICLSRSRVEHAGALAAARAPSLGATTVAARCRAHEALAPR
eukprot:5635579-Pleurochrysis_carterae.AAC.1